LQECQPWWPPALAHAGSAQHRLALTSRNLGLPVRQAIAVRAPDLIRSNAGGCNAILVRGQITDDRARTLTRRPERRVVHGVEVAGAGWFANLHATVHDAAAARRDIELARTTALDWARGAPLVIGGDLNIRKPLLPELEKVATSDVDHLFVRGWRLTGSPEVLERGRLSDHAPVAVTLEPVARPSPQDA